MNAITVNVDKRLWFMPFSSMKSTSSYPLYEADTQGLAVINITSFHSFMQRPVHPDKTHCAVWMGRNITGGCV